MTSDQQGETEPAYGEPVAWARPVRDGVWTGSNGVVWRRRGGPLEAKSARRLLRRPDLLVLHAYSVEPRMVDGAEASAVLGRVAEFLDGDAPDFSEFTVGEFRDDARRVLLVIEELC